jgi:hypothetical protein
MNLRSAPSALLAVTLLGLAATPAVVAQAPPAPAPSAAAPAPAFDPGRLNPDAPPETRQFGRFAGIWDVDMKIRQDDGSWPEKGFPAEWRFRYALDGWAIQDDWFAPPPDRPVEEGGRRQLGTNLRIYDPAAKHWDVAWISNTQQQLSTFEAVAEGDDGMVMTGLHASGKPSRTTFYDVTDDSFDWRLELQGLGEDPEAWTEVARIHAERRR